MQDDPDECDTDYQNLCYTFVFLFEERSTLMSGQNWYLKALEYVMNVCIFL